MKYKALLYATAVALIGILSCSRETVEIEIPESTEVELEFTASWAGEENTRTALQADGTSIWWTSGEEINVFFGTGASGKFVSENTEPQPVVSFHGTLSTIVGGMETGGDKPAYWAVYPYNASNTCDGESVTLSLPSNQMASGGSFADHFFPAVATGETYSLAFYNVCGGARFSVAQEGITKVVFESNDGSPMVAGKVRVGFGEDGKPVVLDITDGESSVVVNAPAGGFVPGVNYFASMLPQAHNSGITVTLYTATKKATRTISTPITVKRSVFGKLDNVDAGLSDTPVPEAIDLGLSVKWASWNVGASVPEEYGDYYAWGETETKDCYDWSTYKWCNGSKNNLTKYNTSSSNGTVDNKIVLDPEDDVAHVTLGDNWRMPTDAEWTELRTQCTWTWTTQNGVNGIKVTGPNGSSIFLPAAGERYGTDLNDAGSYGLYWSSSLYTDGPDYAWTVLFGSVGVDRICIGRCCGYSVRPVEPIAVPGVSLNKTELTLYEGKSTTLTATVTPSTAANQSVNWSSSNPSVATVDQTGKVTGVKAGSAVITVITVDGGYTASCAVSVVEAPEFKAVDLGLSVRWASFNLGASAPEEYGDYYAWGETETKNGYDWPTYKWCNGSYNNLTKYNTSSSCGTVDNKTVLDPEDDVAQVTLGGNWRMPTDEDWTELRTQCTWTWTTQNGVYGRKVTGPNGNSIFLPAAGWRDGSGLEAAGSYGYYWSSSLYTDYPSGAWGVYFGSDDISRNIFERFFGFSIRPVEPISVTGVSLDKTELTLYEGKSSTLTATVTGTNKSVTWSSSNPSVATVDQTGKVTGVKAGSAVITVITVDGGYTASCAVSVVEFEAIDLGLSVKWASFNLGASAPEEYGDYYAWGETETKSNYSWSTYKWCNGSHDSLTKYNTSSSYGTVDNKTVLDPEDDVAHVVLGGNWRMPTDAEWTELRTQCTWTWTTQNGVNGRKVTGPNGNSVFLPAAGYRGDTILYGAGSYGGYWSSSLNTDNPNLAWLVYFYSGNVYRDNFDHCIGLSVRPVSE